jgi:hypothetical protein
MLSIYEKGWNKLFFSIDLWEQPKIKSIQSGTSPERDRSPKLADADQ